MKTFTIIRPDDWHLHLRDGPALATTVGHTARRFARAIIMPNLAEPVTSIAVALSYRDRILAAIPDGLAFKPLMTLYLTDTTSAEDIRRVTENQHIVAAKLYPAGATTNSKAGVTNIEKIYPTLEAMEKHRFPLLVHGEVTDSDIDIFDRERVFIERRLSPIAERFPGLKIVFEHITTKDAVDFVSSASPNIAATITAHHLLHNRNIMLAGGIRPHYYCLPVLKSEPHRQALLEAATSGNPKFFLGTDSAPHAITKKEAACGCAGIYTAFAGIELYVEIFEKAGALDKLEGFASIHGADFYGLPQNKEYITLVKRPWTTPNQYPLGDDFVVPFHTGKQISWSLCENNHRTIQ